MPSKTAEKMDAVGVEAIEGLREFASKGVGFIEQQAPEVCDEIIMRGIASHAVGVCFSVAVLLVVVLYFRKVGFARWLIAAQEGTDGWDASIAFPGGIGLLAGLLASLIAIINTYDMVMIIVAPRLYIMEYLIDLAK